MKNIFYLSSLILLSVFMISCGDDEEVEMTDFSYHAHIVSPDTADKHIGDQINLQVEFESHTGETIHNIQVRIYNAADESIEMFKMHQHAHTTESVEISEVIDLIAENNVEAHTDWIVEAKIWAMDAGVAEVTETLQFHVHP